MNFSSGFEQSTKMTGEDVKTIRGLLGISQDRLSKILDVSGLTIYRWEKNQQGISGENQKRLLEIYSHVRASSIKDNQKAKEATG